MYYFSELITRDLDIVPGLCDIQHTLGRHTKVEGAEHTGNSIEVSGQVFHGPRGLWTECLCFLGVGESRRGFILSAILDLCWQIFFWCFWLLFILGK